MKIFATSDIKEIDRLTMQYEPISSIDLMRRASLCFANELLTELPQGKVVYVMAGNGNNGGDAVFVAYFLKNVGVEVQLFHCDCGGAVSADCAESLRQFSEKYQDCFHKVCDVSELPAISGDDVLIDGLFGSGLNRPLQGFYAEVVKFVNNADCTVFAIDIPSGLMGEDNSQNDASAILHADYTYTFQFPKLSFLLPENADYVGSWRVLDIGLSAKAIDETPGSCFFLDDEMAEKMLKPRAKFSHKGTYGHALIVGGSRGKMGAAVLASKACLRSGVGLLTAYVPRCGYEIMQISVPEAMTMDDAEENLLAAVPDAERYDAVGVGVGIGQDERTAAMLSALLKQSTRPMVLDADALNIVSLHREMFGYIPKNSILTPHPKEFDRLTSPSATTYERLQKALALSAEWQVYVVLKGAHTAVVCPDGKVYFNSTGNPGMATAGSGDVLCGVITSLLAQRYTPLEAALLGVYAHGKAGDRAAAQRSQQNMTAADIVEHLFR